MSSTITFTRGIYKEKGGSETVVDGHTFELTGKWSEYADGSGFYTVKGSSASPELNLPSRSIRIRCLSPSDAVINGNEQSASNNEYQSAVSERLARIATETDEEIIERLRMRFDILKDMATAVKSGVARGMIVAGPPGVGKSFGVEEVLAQANLFNKLAAFRDNYEIVKGAMSALGLYRKLYDRREHGNVIVFDDCDSVFTDPAMLNILKAALDTSTTRRIHWNTDSHALRREGIPNSFTFHAGIIFITNISFENVRSKNLKSHLDALQSRCHYIDLGIDSTREKLLRIRQIINDGMLESYNFELDEVNEIVSFVSDHAEKLREISLRTVLKVADLRKAMPDKWQRVAQMTVVKEGM
jgi:hypothetical protein